MLVLSRRIGESLKIGDDIELTILTSERGQIRIGIEAPKNVNIVRSELLFRGNQQAPNDRTVEPRRQVLRTRQYGRKDD